MFQNYTPLMCLKFLTWKFPLQAKNTGEIREINQRLSRVDASKDRLVDVDGELKKTVSDGCQQNCLAAQQNLSRKISKKFLFPQV